MKIREIIEDSLCLLLIFAFAYYLLILGSVLGLNSFILIPFTLVCLIPFMH
jgi:hypothetical protein